MLVKYLIKFIFEVVFDFLYPETYLYEDEDGFISRKLVDEEHKKRYIKFGEKEIWEVL